MVGARQVAEAAGAAPVWERVAACRMCAPRFGATRTAHEPRPVVRFRPGARVLIASQAPGMRAHRSGVPFQDASGARLKGWMGLGDDEFHDLAKVAIVPMGFCFPGYDAGGGDIPPPAACWETWRRPALAALGSMRVTLLVGGMAQAWHLGAGRVDDRARAWREHAPAVWPLPHPSWRNTAWLKRNPWFEAEAVPALRSAIREALDG